MLIALPAFQISYLLANDTLSTVLITEGDRGLALEKLLQFKCNDTWTPLMRQYTYDKEGNIYSSVRFGYRLEIPDGNVKNNPNIYANAIIKFSSDYEVLWYKEVNVNTKDDERLELNIVCDEMFFDPNEDRMYVYVHVEKSDSIHVDTLYYENHIVAVLDTGKTLQNQDQFLISVDTYDGHFIKSIQIPYHKRLSDFICAEGQSDGIYHIGEIYNNFEGEDWQCGVDKWYFAKLTADLEPVWEYAIGGERIEYLYHAFGFNEPETRMYIFGDTMYLAYPFQSDSIQINPDQSNPVYVYSSCYEMGISGLGLHNLDAVIEKLSIADDTIKLLAYKKVGWDSVPQIIRQGKDGTLEALFYWNDLRNYDTLRCYKVNSDLSFTAIEEPYKGINSQYMHQIDQKEEFYFDYDEDFNHVELNMLFGKDHVMSFSDKAKDIQYKNVSNAEEFVKYTGETDFCYTYIMPILQPVIKTSPLLGCLFVSGEGDFDYNVNGSALNWNPWEKNQIVSSRENDGGVKSCFLAIYRETFRVKGESYGKGKVIVPDTLTWFGNDCEVQIVPEKGYRVDSVLTDRGDRLEATEDGGYIVPSVKDVVTVKAYFSEGSAVEENSSDDISIYPNPFTDGIDIVSEKDLRYEMMDARAAIVKTGAEKHVDARTLPQGLYVMRLYDGKELVKTKKIIKE